MRQRWVDIALRTLAYALIANCVLLIASLTFVSVLPDSHAWSGVTAVIGESSIVLETLPFLLLAALDVALLARGPGGARVVGSLGLLVIAITGALIAVTTRSDWTSTSTVWGVAALGATFVVLPVLSVVTAVYGARLVRRDAIDPVVQQQSAMP